MRRIYALAISVALLMATPGLATADPYTAPVSRQQAIQYVISRALAQRGVPYTYGGGNASGPTLGAKPAADVADTSITGMAPAPAVGGLTQTPQIGLAPAPALGALTPAPALAGAAPAPTVVGFDASGLVLYAFAGVGIKLPRSSGQQYAALQKVLPSQALPGDLIFFGPEGSDSVALFVGNGQMLEATNPAVAVSPVRTNNMAPYLGRVIAQ
ncbi:NlpC/P60 family peptidoglycan-binding protein RipD [Mycobacterium sp. AZCC_0083]|jgi:cell wall-associated NlpC family hydrolase|uniref:NlpC/P60 family peptidoglycan-binding protein RipD n=1 Tax=Mycobacterium sp. AZCC_0083 TaxID=2735882 RepID=UPI001617E74D|nr:NlpC/P60 family peptidoglycan-binding protein RipD [Mycobacterium sp. AZCC_0083]MBB5161092.1 cell wall-associated NlpC family hydrolase [Mycobacterium sp. AZCC_0083]